MAKSSTIKKIVLLDAHAILHRAYHALPGFSTSDGRPTGALYGLISMVIKIIGDLSPDYVIACYDLPKPTHRHVVYKEYKSGRKKTDEALIDQIKNSRGVFEALSIPIYDHEGFEADDILGTIVELLKKDKEAEIIIASGDMDTLQLVSGTKVKVFTFKKGLNDTVTYDEEKVVERFGFLPTNIPDYKGLSGDQSDNIIGIVGIGEKTATTLISQFQTIENIYKNLKKDENILRNLGLTVRVIELLKAGEEDALFSKELATIRRDAPIDFSLPKKTWMESIDFQKITDILRQYEFRSLTGRLQKLTGTETPTPTQKEPELTTTDIRIFSLMLWLLDSSKSNPAIEDIFEESRAKEKDAIFYNLYKKLEKESMVFLFEKIEKPLIPIIDAMTERGIRVSREVLASLSTEYHKESDVVQNKIWKLAGKEFNINSPKQLGEILFDTLELTAKNLKKTQGGARSTRESELVKLKDAHPIVNEILEYRELQKLLNTYIDTIPLLLDKNDRLHSTFNQMGTTTGRMSSDHPNLQNIPIKGERGKKIRDAFIASEGFVLISCDYSQIELRIAAMLSGDTELINIFKEGKDIHRSVAARVFNVEEKDVTSEMRNFAKTINFGILYGMGVSSLQKGLGTDRKTAQEFYDNYFKTFSRLARYLEETKAFAKKNGYTKTYFGRKRRFHDINSHIPYIQAAAERTAINAPIQGTQADIIKLAMIKLDDYITNHNLKNRVHLLVQVHDELIFEVEKDLVQEMKKIIPEIMSSILSKEETKGVEIAVDTNVGSSWGEL